ncbi:hypothetical protein [Streptomyces sp. NPDC059076]|uniref:hypothetical protein n=1 Tax=unclassified Streptomyces TaxID=2593676 RepID=UPI0036D1F1EC
MGAALHLAHAHQKPIKQRRPKRTGGGSGDGYDRLVTRVYQDPRMTPEARELILVLAWLIARDPNRFDEHGNLLRTWRKRAVCILGEYGPGPRKESRLADLLYADRPRYEPARLPWQQQPCDAPMVRREGTCGQPARGHEYEVDQETGQWTPVWFCRRHDQWGRSLHQQRVLRPGPEPIPNAGGLVPSYLAVSDLDAWARLYKEAAVWKGDQLWEPPKAYGLCADGWPVPGQDPVPQRSRLRLVLGGADLDGTE